MALNGFQVLRLQKHIQPYVSGGLNVFYAEYVQVQTNVGLVEPIFVLYLAGYNAPYLSVYSENAVDVFDVNTTEWIQSISLKKVSD